MTAEQMPQDAGAQPLRDALCAALADRQEPDGGWTGSTAEHDNRWEAVNVLVHHLLDAVDQVREAQQRARLLGQQNDDGGFPLHAEGPSELSCTVLAHVGLQLIGSVEDLGRLDRAARFARRLGGIDAPEARTARFWLAFSGATSWNRTEPLPAEVLLLPARISEYLAAAVSVVQFARPVRELPIDITSLRVAAEARPALRTTAVTAVHRAAHAVARSPLRLPRCSTAHSAAIAALDELARVRVGSRPLGNADRRGPSSVPDTALVLRSLAAAGYRAGSDPLVDAAILRLLPHCGAGLAADVDDTSLVLTALHASGAPGTRPGDTAVAETIQWLLERRSANGGWSRHGASGRALLRERALTGPGFALPATPLVTAHVVEALCAAGRSGHPAVRRALQFLMAEQAVEGFWKDGVTSRIHCTTQVLLALTVAGAGRGNLAVEGAMEWIYQRQNPDGGWGGKLVYAPDTDARMHPSTVAQTAQCLIAAHATGVLDVPRTDAALAFLLNHQRRDGNWGSLVEHPNDSDGAADEQSLRDVRTNAYALWAIALHTRHAKAAGPDVSQTGARVAMMETASGPAEYDTWSSLWWQRRGPLAILHWGARARAEHIPVASRPGAVLLDVACGGGLLHPHIAGKGYRHIGVDVSTKSAEVALRHGVDEVLIHDIHDIPLPDGYADVVVAGYCLEHVARPFDVVAECCRLLKPGGTLVLDTIANTFLARLSVIILGEGLPVSWAAPKGTHDHRLFIAPRRIAEACAAQGVPVDVFGVVPHIPDLLAWSVGRGYDVRLRSGTFTKILYGVAGVKAQAAT